MKKYLFPIIVLFSLASTSCSKSKQTDKQNKEIVSEKTKANTISLIGSWVQPNPIDDKQVQGFALKADGTAESINMHTLVYKEWWQKGDDLTLVSESIGSGLSFLDTTTYEITKLDNKELVLKHGDLKLEYSRE